MLLHDTNVRRDDFGVYPFFAEIAKECPSFEFLHSFGLGVLAVGAAAPAAAQQLCSLTREQDISTVRERFSHLGARWFVTARESLSVAAAEARIAEAIAQAKAEAERARAEAEARIAEAIAQAKAEAERARAEAEARIAEAIAQAKAEAERARAEAEARIAEAITQGEAAKAEAERARAEKETSERIRKRVVQRVRGTARGLRSARDGVERDQRDARRPLPALCGCRRSGERRRSRQGAACRPAPAGQERTGVIRRG